MKNYLRKIQIANIREVFKWHLGVIAGAFFIGILTISPNLFFITSLGDSYEGLYIMKTDAESYYISRVKEFYDGNGMSNPYIYEYKFTEPPATPGFVEAPIAYLGMLSGVSVPSVVLIFTFLITVLIALLVYTLAFQLIKNQFWSIVLMALVMLGKVLFDVSDILHLINLETVYTQFTIFSRPAIPQISTMVFFLYLNTLIKATKSDNLRWYVYLGMIFGISFYIYLYNFTFLVTFNFILIFGFLFFGLKDKALKLFLSSALGVSVGSYAILQILQTTQNPFYDFFSFGLGLGPSRSLIISTGWLIVMFIFLFFLFFNRKEQKRENIILLWALMFTSFVVVNQQIITGKILQEGHYHWYFNIPVFSIVLVYILYNFLRNRLVLSYVVGIFIIISSVFASSFIQYSSYNYWYDSVKEDQRYMSIFKWLDENTPAEQVVFANEEISSLIPVFTDKNVVWDVMAYNFFWSEERAAYKPETILKSDDFALEIKKYKVDYIVWDKIKNPDWNLDKYVFLRIDYSSGGIDILTILPH